MRKPTPQELDKLQQMMRYWESDSGVVPSVAISAADGNFNAALYLMDLVVVAISEYIQREREKK